MNNSFNQADVSAILARIEKLTPDSQRQWGKMNVAQMLAHCNAFLETAMGLNFIKRLFIGRIIGTLMRPRVLGENHLVKIPRLTKAISLPAIIILRRKNQK